MRFSLRTFLPNAGPFVKIRVPWISPLSQFSEMQYVVWNTKNSQFLVMVIKSKCLGPLAKRRVWWIASLSQFQEFQYVSWNTKILHVHQVEMLQMLRAPRGKSGLSPQTAKSAPRRSKSTTFAKGIFQLFNLQKIAMNPIGDPSVLPIQYPIYLWLQVAAGETFGIGGWCYELKSSIRNLQSRHKGMW